MSHLKLLKIHSEKQYNQFFLLLVRRREIYTYEPKATMRGHSVRRCRENYTRTYLWMETSGSFKQSRIVARCRWTAFESACTTRSRVFSATYRISLSVFNKNRPSILTANTLIKNIDTLEIVRWQYFINKFSGTNTHTQDLPKVMQQASYEQFPLQRTAS